MKLHRVRRRRTVDQTIFVLAPDKATALAWARKASEPWKTGPTPPQGAVSDATDETSSRFSYHHDGVETRPDLGMRITPFKEPT